MKNMLRFVFSLSMTVGAVNAEEFSSPTQDMKIGDSVKVEGDGYEPLIYDRKYMDAITEEYLWSNHEEIHKASGLPDGSGSPKAVTQIDDDFFDTFIVNRWTGGWLAGDTTWVIALA